MTGVRRRGEWHDARVVELDWRALLAADGGFRLREPATAGDLARVEAALGVALTAELRALYLVSDGVYAEQGQWFVIWPLADVVERNSVEQVGSEGPARRELIGFGDDGTGAPFCVARGGEAGVHLWSPITQEADQVGATVEDFWRTWTA